MLEWLAIFLGRHRHVRGIGDLTVRVVFAVPYR